MDGAFLQCTGLIGSLTLPESITLIENNAFNSTNFSIVIYEGMNSPNCTNNLGFKNVDKIYVNDFYVDDNFCGMEIIYINPKPTPTQSPTPTPIPILTPTLVPNKIGEIIGIIIGSIIGFLIICLVIIFLICKSRAKSPQVNPSKLLESN